MNAPTHIVWDRILDYNNYAKMVPKTLESQNYRVEHHHGRQTIYTRMKIGFSGINLQFYIKHQYDPKLDSLTWTLDYTKKSDLDDSVGFWYVIPHPDYPDAQSRVYYSVEVRLFDWIPKFVVQFLSQKALTEATAWVKKFSELKYKEEEEEEQQQQQQQVMMVIATDDNKVPEMKGRWFSRRNTQDDETCTPDDDSAVIAVNKQTVGISRYAMVVSVFVLALYNIHLCFSQ